MSTSMLVLLLALLMLLSYWYGLKRSLQLVGGHDSKQLLALPSQFGWLTALWCGIPALICLVLWMFFESLVIESLLLSQLPLVARDMSEQQWQLFLNDLYILKDQTDISHVSAVKQQALAQLQHLYQVSAWLKTLWIWGCAVTGVVYISGQFTVTFPARQRVEQFIKWFLMASSGIAILTTLGIVVSVLFESITFFSLITPQEFLLGTHWSPQIAVRSDQVGSSSAFGAIPLFTGTLLITLIALCIALPIGLMGAIYLSSYASDGLRAVAKPVLELLAGIPTVVYGFFAALTVAPMIRQFGSSWGISIASESALAVGVVVGIMIIPYISSLSDDAIRTVPKSIKEASLGMGATLSETIKFVLLPAAMPGILGAVLLAISRAIGETMIVVMAAGLAANLTMDPFASVTTVTVQMLTLLTGDQEFDSTKTLAAFALGLMLFLTTLFLNVVALTVVRNYHRQYR